MKSMIDEYARLIVRVGVNIQKGQTLVITSPIECVDFIRLVTKHAYNRGAKDVYVDWRDDKITRMRYMNAPYEIFDVFPKWHADAFEDFAKGGGAFLSILAPNPGLLDGVDPERIELSHRVQSSGFKGFMEYKLTSKVCWCVASVPTKAWAKKVFKDLPDDEALDMLWQAVLQTVRADTGDIMGAWREHLDNFKSRVEFLNSKRFKILHYTAKDTDLNIELSHKHVWGGGGYYSQSGTYFVPNIPTEEIATIPVKTGVNGKVKSTMPLNYGGALIENFSLTFKDGKVVNFSAEKGYDALKRIIELDEGSLYMGEVALVPCSSPISQLGITFYNTLFDENASCHLALGAASPGCIQGGNDMGKEELRRLGVNESGIHVDFMVGSKDLDIIGETESGEQIQIFRAGEWAF